ncbi:hypothetical protein [Vibrio ouci]|uniref:Polysaccharide biosynthesis protein n=1 Tax=Vibrio ouci TaxID=2499078 RepID=A0A4Y8WL52_9VIBR|nr:hypothetical protein [Vibrio ouci]TFH92998.1 hypothetical protein ELS82_03330 [Vibrio ouci]
MSNKSDFIILLAGRLIQVALTLVALRVSTTILPQLEMGYVYYLIVLQSFFTLFLISPVGQFFNRQASKWYDNNIIYSNYIKQVVYISLISVLSTIVLFFAKLLGYDLPSYSLLVVSSCLVLSQSSNQTIVPLLNMLGHRRAFVSFSLITAIFSLLMSFIFITFFGATAFSWLLGIVVGNLIVTIIATLWFKTTLTNNQSNAGIDLAQLRRFCLPIAIATIFMWFLNSGYRMVVEGVYGLEFLAFLGVGLSVSSQVFSIAESLLTQYFIPGLFKKSEVDCEISRTNLVNSYFSLVIPLYVSLALFLTHSIEYFFPYIIAEQYYDAYHFAIYGAWIELGRVLTNAFAIVSQVERKTSKFLFPYAFGAVFLFLSMSLNNEFYSVVSIETLLVTSGFIVLITMYFFMKRSLKFTIPIKGIVLFNLFTLPAIIFFNLFNIPTSISIASLILCFIGGLIYILGVFLAYFFSFKYLEVKL